MASISYYYIAGEKGMEVTGGFTPFKAKWKLFSEDAMRAVMASGGTPAKAAEAGQFMDANGPLPCPQQIDGIMVWSHYEGPWQVGSGSKGWYVLNTETGSTKFIGPVRMRGTNYCLKAREIASARNSSIAAAAA